MKAMRKERTPGFTMVELLIALSLAGMVLLSIVTIDIALRRFFNVSDYESRLLNEASPILDMIAKDAKRAYGNTNSPGVRLVSSNRIELRLLDSGYNYEDLSDDAWVAYGFDPGNHTVTVQRNCTARSGPPLYTCTSWNSAPSFNEVVGRNVLDCDFTVSNIASGNNQNANLWLTVALTARRNVAIAAGPENPEVRLNTSVSLRSQSIN